VSKSMAQQEQNERPFAAATIEVENAAWLNLLLEAEQRKDELKRINATVAAMRSAHETMSKQYQEEYIRKNKEIIAAREDATRHKNQLIVVARALCPILRQFNLFVASFPATEEDQLQAETLKNGREMLKLLEHFEKM